MAAYFIHFCKYNISILIWYEIRTVLKIREKNDTVLNKTNYTKCLISYYTSKEHEQCTFEKTSSCLCGLCL